MSGTGDGAAPGERDFYDRVARQFWDPKGPMHALHTINPLRATWVEARAREHLAPLSALRVLDVGCGAGLLSEALAATGARVTGIDVSEENVAVARTHAAESGLAVDYRAGTLTDAVPPDERFDVVCCLEVVEHVADLRGFLAALAVRVRPGGLLFVSSISRTPESLALAKVAAEYILGLLPRGTHRWADFRNPDEVDAALRRHALRRVALTGMGYAPFVERAWWQRNTRVNWMGAWQREGAPPPR